MNKLIKKYGKKIVAVALAVFIFLLVVEIGIRISGKFSTLSEKTGNGFLSLFAVNHEGVLNKHATNQPIRISNSEFEYVHEIDRYGFRNRPMDSCSILAIGDSFTEGLGAPQDSTWPAQLALLENVNVYNAGIMGSDPVYGYKLLVENYLPYHPSTVIFAINYSDITDMVIRGGEERFMEDGTVRYHEPPWFMSLYRVSHLFRAVLHLLCGYDYMFNSSKNREPNIQQALAQLEQTLIRADSWCKSQGIEMWVFIHPVPQEYYTNLDRRLSFTRIDTLAAMLDEKSVRCINLRPRFEQRLQTPEEWKMVSWPVDGHFNSNGYKLMSEFIYEEINREK